VLRADLDDFILVSDAQLRSAQRLMMSHAHTLAEGAGAAGLAGVLADRNRFAGRRVGVAVTGANASPAEITEILAAKPEPGVQDMTTQVLAAGAS
jgi:threonine dehydratase